MNKTKKEYDAVEMMRAAREKLSAKIEGMTLEEELNWLASQKAEDLFLQRLQRRIAQQASTTGRPLTGR